MTSYDERLQQFASERSLVRLTPAVVNRRDALCDACGSHQPRVLHALRDRSSGRHHFVGQSCLEALTERGAVGRRSTRARTEQAYEEELDLRQAEMPPGGEASCAAGDADGKRAAPEEAEPPAGAMLVVAILQPPEWAALLELVGAERDACLVVPLGEHIPSLAGAALSLDHLGEFAERAYRVHSQR